jgi:Ion channel
LPRAAIIENRAKVLAALGGAMIGHVLQIMLFAGPYYLLRDNFSLRCFGGEFKDSFSSFLYFSSETNATLGLGDIYPSGSLRLVTGSAHRTAHDQLDRIFYLSGNERYWEILTI